MEPNLEITQNIAVNHIRNDLEIISQIIKNNSKVIDIGCGNGELLYWLKTNHNCQVQGIEICEKKAIEAVKKGVFVLNGEATHNLKYYPDNSFDYAILSQTIQATQDPKLILEEMVRIANFIIISLPNFAHLNNRLQLLFKGKMPVNKNIPFQWFNTPNIHFCSILDFEEFCQKLNLFIIKKTFLTNKNKFPKLLNYSFFANLFAQFGIFLISKNEIVENKELNFSILQLLKFFSSKNNPKNALNLKN